MPPLLSGMFFPTELPPPHLTSCSANSSFMSKHIPLFLLRVFFDLSWMHTPQLLQKGGPLPGPQSELLSNLQKWTVQGEICAEKARGLIGKGRLGGEQEGKGTWENCSATWFTVSGFMVMGLLSRLSLPIILTHSPSWWCTHCSAKMDAREKDSGRWPDAWGLLLTFPELFQLVVAY